jgi:methylenetetrahydrofolate--tRNA-(uracil-5-)-methyltransferase
MKKQNEKQIKVAVIGAGLAGSECAWILAEKYGILVSLFEMKSIEPTPAQVSPHLFSELVCSNSLKSKSRLNPAGILKQEILKLGSLIVPSALETEVPAGETLAVDREKFSGLITSKLKSHPNIQFIPKVIQNVNEIFQLDSFSAVVIATGPLTAQALSEDLLKVTNSKDLYFYDAIAL